MTHLHVVFSKSKGTINRNIYGHFSEHIGGVFYDGLWVGEDSPQPNIRGFRKALVDSFRRLTPPVLRWPGGCFAETYDWRDGIGPRDLRPTRVNWWYSHDKRTESNAVGTHEFMDFCRMTGAEPYVAANITSLTPLTIRDWVEYCNFPAGSTTWADLRGTNGDPAPFNVRYWGIGNENWGGGGQMTPEMYAREYIRYSTIVNSLDKGKLRFIACGPNGHDLDWTERFFREYAKRSFEEAPTYGFSVHYYCGSAGDPVAFTADEWYQQLFQADGMRAVLDDHRAAMNAFDPEKKIGLIVDEWGCWHKDGSGPSKGYNLFEQQSTLRDAAVAALTLNIFNNRCDSVAMANVAQLCNNLHALYLAGGEHFVETPTYFVFDMFKGHMDAKQLHVIHDCGAFEREGFAPLTRVSSSASVREDGSVLITLANMDIDEPASIALHGVDGRLDGKATVTVLAGDPHDHNTFERPNTVRSRSYVRDIREGDTLDVPAAGIVAVQIAR